MPEPTYVSTSDEAGNKVYSPINVPPSGIYVATNADFTSSVTAVVAIPGTSVALAALTKYLYIVRGTFTSAVTTTGVTLSLGGAAAVGLTGVKLAVGLQATATSVTQYVITSGVGNVNHLSSLGPTIPGVLTIQGTFTTGAVAGALDLRAASEIAASAMTIQAGLLVELRPI